MIQLKVQKRQTALTWHAILIYIVAILLSMATAALLLAIQDKPALHGLWLLISGAFGTLWAWEDCLVKSVPIFLCSLGVGIAFRLQIWNIGAEGQFALGAVGATWAVLTFPDAPAYLLLPAMLVMASVCGGLWGLLPAILKVRLRSNEIIVTLMLNYIAILILDYLVFGPWKDPASFGFPMTREFPAAAVVGLIGDTRLNWGLLLSIITGILLWLFFAHTRLGYEIQACGANVRAARYARIPYERMVLLVMVLSGMLAGWAGFLEASANLNRLQPSIMVGYGYTAIVVAWLARLNPLYIGIGAFLLAGLRVGLENLQLELQVPAAFGNIMEGLVLLTVLAGSFFTRYHLRMWRTS